MMASQPSLPRPRVSAIVWRSGFATTAHIPPEVKEKMFNPFFTTKPAGEGTGLGLSISHDIIVKQHGGSIEVETEPGEFTEIRVILPRTAALLPERSCDRPPTYGS
jgi:K+-sensing histidine kinase KdpD